MENSKPVQLLTLALGMNSEITYGFSRSERLKSKKLIGQLFREGKAVKAYPLRLVWLEVEPYEGTAPIQFTVSVPKRKFKRAVDRNRIKRQIRECYRLIKPEVYPTLPAGKHFILMALYVSPEKLKYKQIDKAVKKGFKKWNDQIQQ